ncbi:hypothetical protein [Epibacterium ulvae]|uniref:hypothetical protein n=1 Tax=Epibacterium ulvae TaxID=1156985 RepID=UPI002490400E|nr:hypothetical protein [Epibacterium ulvae]
MSRQPTPTMYETAALRSTFRSMLKKAGCSAAVGMAIKEKCGRDIADSTLSKIANGQMRFDWDVAFMLEDIVGEYPFTALMNGRREDAVSKSDLEVLVEAAVKEIGEVPAAVIHGLRTGDFEKLLKEGPEGLAALEALLQHVKEAEGGRS